MESSSAAAFDEQQNSLISSFLEIAICQTPETAKQFLQATGWKLEEALQLFYVGNDGGEVASTSSLSAGNINSQIDQTVCGSKGEYDKENVGQHYEDEVRPPLPVKREALYEDAMLYASSREGYPANESSSLIAFRNFNEEMKHPGVWESEQISASKPESSRDNLASLYRPPFHLMFHGSFDKAKASASAQDKWLIVNLQSTKEFSSHMLNRDTWANEAVSQTISTNFIFWQVYEDTTEGRKVCTYYKLDSIPVVLVIDPITGQKMRAWSGMIQPESLLEDLLPYLDGGPRNHHATLSHKRPRESSVASHTTKVIVEETKRVNTKEALPASDEGTPSVAVSKNLDSSDSERAETCLINHPAYPQLPEEPEVDRNLICRVGVRLPDGRRVQRNFLRADPIQLLWSFCYSQLEEAKTRSFRLAHAIPGASKFIDYDEKLTFEESGLANSMISVTWV